MKFRAGLVVIALLAGCGEPMVSPGLQGPDPSVQSAQALAVSSLQADFDALDAQHRGYLTRADFPYLTDAQFGALDKRGDGEITFDEGVQPGEIAAMARIEAEVPQVSQAGAQALGALGFSADPVARPPILLLPGYFEPTALWLPFMPRLRAAGYTHIYTLGTWPDFNDMRLTAAEVKAKVAQIQAETGASRIDVVGHSEGGLILRYWIERLGGAPLVDHYVSFATPHEGTLVAYLGPGESAVQMRPGSAFLEDLDAGPLEPAPGKYSALWSHTDEIVIPQGNGQLPGAVNTSFPIAEHAELCWLGSAEQTGIADLSR